MSITSIQNVTNGRSKSIMFINTETSGNNRTIDPRRTVGVGNCWIPWCTNERDFPAHHLEVIEVDSGAVLWYIWQQRAFDGDFIRISTDGFKTPEPAHVIDGSADVGHSYNLYVDDAGVATGDSQ